MATRLRLTGRGVLNLRLARSPLHEVFSTVTALVGGRRIGWAPGHDLTARRHLRLDGPLGDLAAVVSAAGFFPDALAPPPATARPTLAAQLDQVAAVPADRVEHELAAHAALFDRPLAPLPRDIGQRVADQLHVAHRMFVEPHGDRPSERVHAEMTRLEARVAADGWAPALSSLSRDIQLVDDEVVVDTCRVAGSRSAVCDRGLVLIPSPTLTHHSAVGLPDEDAPYVLFPAGLRPLDDPPLAGSARARRLLGATRHRLLGRICVLGDSTVTEIARDGHLAASTAHAHLAFLVEAGLMSRRREGRIVLYRVTEAGRQMLGDREPAGALWTADAQRRALPRR